jgi:hypothetical protein
MLLRVIFLKRKCRKINFSSNSYIAKSCRSFKDSTKLS